MTQRERVQAVLQGEIPDRVPYVEVGIDFPFICKLLDLDLPSGRYFEAGEYESPGIWFVVPFPIGKHAKYIFVIRKTTPTMDTRLLSIEPVSISI
jgi:hypothetical protein